MARNGSGTYNRAVSPYTAGTTITAATVNQEMDDIATALTGSMARDGQSPPTANIPMGGFRITGLANAVASTDAAALGQITAAQAGAVAKAGDTMTGALNYAPEVDLASAGTTDIGAQTSNNVRITGTTTITSFGTAANGVTRQLRFAGALTLTHNATSLILPGGANIVTMAGDTATARSLGSGNWVVTSFQRAPSLGVVVSGTPGVFSRVVIAGAWVIMEGNANLVGSQFDFTLPVAFSGVGYSVIGTDTGSAVCGIAAVPLSGSVVRFFVTEANGTPRGAGVGTGVKYIAIGAP